MYTQLIGQKPSVERITIWLIDCERKQHRARGGAIIPKIPKQFILPAKLKTHNTVVD
jgi:hypothetical protein